MGEETWKTVVMQSPRGPSMSDVLVSVHLVLAESLCAAAKNSSSGHRSPRFMCEETGGEGIVTQPMRYLCSRSLHHSLLLLPHGVDTLGLPACCATVET